MEFRKAQFAKKSYRYQRNDGNQKDEQDSRSGGSRYNRDSRSGGSRFNRNDNGSRFNRGSEDNRRGEMHKATCGDCGNECQIPFKPKYDRPVYCKECFQNHKPQEHSGGSRFSRGSSYGRGASYGRNYRSSGYNQGQTRFQRDRTPINSRDNFRTTKHPPHRHANHQYL